MYKVLAFDFDGVIARYDGNYKGDTSHGEPIAETLAAMRTLRERGYKILIHSTKGTETLQAYCDKYGVPYDYINVVPGQEQGNLGKPRAHAYIDDRAINFHGQSAVELVQEIEQFDSYYKHGTEQ